MYASNTSRFEEGYKKIADRIQLPHRDEPSADIYRLVHDWLCDETHERWIMILDNADDHTLFSYLHKDRLNTGPGEPAVAAKPLSAFLPQTRIGSILVTSRNKDAAARLVGDEKNIIKVEPMNSAQALELFGKKIRGEFSIEDAARLLEMLEYVPLAISQAAAYINQRAPRTTVSKYLDEFRKSDRSKASLLRRDIGDIRRDYSVSSSVFTTWQISFDHIRETRPSAAGLLSLMSLFDRQGIPESLLRPRDIHNGTESDSYSSEEMKLDDDVNRGFEDDLYTLTSYSLIKTVGLEGSVFEMHQLVHLAMKEWLESRADLERWKRDYIIRMSDAFPSADYENWMICQMLFPHAKVAMAYRPGDHKHLLLWTTILNRGGSYARAKGDYTMAEEMLRRALEGRKKALGKEHPDTLISMSNLASVLIEQGQYKEAEKSNRQALALRETVLGKEHPETLISMSNLALVLDEQGQYEEAERIFRQVLALRERVLGKEHPHTLTSVYCLADLLYQQKQYKDAGQFYQRADAGFKKTLGENHPMTAACSQAYSSMLEEEKG